MSCCFCCVLVSEKLVSVLYLSDIRSCLRCVAASCICLFMALQLCRIGVPSRVAS